MKKTIRLSETELHRLIKESVKRALSEGEAWANQPPIDEFHPDWWYYRQEVEPEGLEDFDPCMDLSDEEYDERIKQKFGENDLHRIVKESIRRILKEESEPYKWDGLDDDRKEFEKHLSWRNKEEVDANDKAITNPLSYMNKQDSDRVGQMIQANRTSKPGAKMSWDWGYKSGRGVDDPTDVKTVSDFEKAEDEFVNPYDSKYWHNYALRDEFWDGIPESRTLNKKSTIRLSESDLHRVIRETVKKVLKETKYDRNL